MITKKDLDESIEWLEGNIEEAEIAMESMKDWIAEAKGILSKAQATPAEPEPTTRAIMQALGFREGYRSWMLLPVGDGPKRLTINVPEEITPPNLARCLFDMGFDAGLKYKTDPVRSITQEFLPILGFKKVDDDGNWTHPSGLIIGERFPLAGLIGMAIATGENNQTKRTKQ